MKSYLMWAALIAAVGLGVGGLAYHEHAVDDAFAAGKAHAEAVFEKAKAEAIEQALAKQERIGAEDDKIVERQLAAEQARSQRLASQLQKVKANANEQQTVNSVCNPPVGNIRMLNAESRRMQGLPERAELPQAKARAPSVVTGAALVDWGATCASRYAGLSERYIALLDSVTVREQAQCPAPGPQLKLAGIADG